tara:strand:- start:436 stop:762 length:327 start_codon:yes stop_codon:yes gene_type:complete
MIKGSFKIDDIGVQLEMHNDGLYVAFYLDADHGVKPIKKISIDDLALDYVDNTDQMFREEDIDYLCFELGCTIHMLETKSNSVKHNLKKSLTDSSTEEYSDSGFTDSF